MDYQPRGGEGDFARGVWPGFHRVAAGAATLCDGHVVGVFPRAPDLIARIHSAGRAVERAGAPRRAGNAGEEDAVDLLHVSASGIERCEIAATRGHVLPH